MKFVARKPSNGINVSDTHPLAEAGLLIFGLSFIFVTIALVLVFLVELALRFISPETEADFFSTWIPADLISIEGDDPRLLETRSLTRRLAAHWPDSPYAFRVDVTHSEIPNAMAFPGGLIIVSTALLDRVETENELAFVLAHELGHFRNRDHLRMLGRGVIFSIVFSMLLDDGGGETVGLTVANLTLRGFSRDQESEADLFALGVLQAEYGHVDDSWRFFQRLLAEDLDDYWLGIYLSTHPAPQERIDELREHAAEQEWPVMGPTKSLAW